MVHVYSGFYIIPPDETEQIVPVRNSFENFADQLLRYIVVWNTNSRHTHYAQSTLACIFKTVLPKRLLQLPKISTYVEGLIPYTGL